MGAPIGRYRHPGRPAAEGPSDPATDDKRAKRRHARVPAERIDHAASAPAARRYLQPALLRAVVISDVHIGDGTPTVWYQQAVREPYLATILDYVIDTGTKEEEPIRELVLLALLCCAKWWQAGSRSSSSCVHGTRRRAQEYRTKRTLVHMSTGRWMPTLVCTTPANRRSAVQTTSDIDITV